MRLTSTQKPFAVGNDKAEVANLGQVHARVIDLVDDAVARREPQPRRTERAPHHVLGAAGPCGRNAGMAWGLHDVYTRSAPTARASNTAQVSSAMPKADVTRHRRLRVPDRLLTLHRKRIDRSYPQPMPRRSPAVVLAPDSFKGSLSASAAAAAIAEGLRRVWPDADLRLCPMADGGEGTLDAVLSCGGQRLTDRVERRLGQAASCRLWIDRRNRRLRCSKSRRSSG